MLNYVFVLFCTVGEGIADVSVFLMLPPIPFLGGKYLHIKAKVEAYLQKTFYNLTTVALHNWRTYGEMRALATHKYKVKYLVIKKITVWLRDQKMLFNE